MSYEELDQMIDEIDADGSGTVDFDGKPTRAPPPGSGCNVRRGFCGFLCDVRAPAKTNAIADKAFRANIDHKTSV
jgi:hypothetical protein